MKLASVAMSALCISLTGCSLPHSIKEGGPLPGHAVNPQEIVKILNVRDGQESGQPVAVGSGRGMASALRKALTEHAIPITLSDSIDVKTGLDEALHDGSGYVLQCTITLWEDNATAWSGNGDKLNIDVELYDVRTHQVIAAATHARTATGSTFVAGTPDRFMDEVANGALGRIYGWPSAK